MTGSQLLELFARGTRRCHLIGTDRCGVVAGLDLEGRLYAILDGEVLNRVNPDAFAGISRCGTYLNPGGDGLWPAPEGSVLGYEYATGAWRVPPGLTNARYWVTETTADRAVIRAEIDIINAEGRGIPTAFERDIRVRATPNALHLTVRESIEYLGTRPLNRRHCLLAPWTLAQFDCGPGCRVTFPVSRPADAWDLYDPPTLEQRRIEGGVCLTRTEGNCRYQLGIAPVSAGLEYLDPRRNLRVRRTAEPLAPGCAYLDITDRAPTARPHRAGIRYSVYNDANGFMEIEAAGGGPATLTPGTRLELVVHTEYARI